MILKVQILYSTKKYPINNRFWTINDMSIINNKSLKYFLYLSYKYVWR